jgi:hypothetical protein
MRQDQLFVGVDPGAANLAIVAFSPTRGVVLAVKPPKKDLPTGVRRLSYIIHFIKSQLGELEKTGSVVRIACEGYSMAEKFGQHAAGEVGGAIKLALVGWFGLDNPIGYPIIVAPQQLKKFTTGKGNAPKDIMTKEVLKRWGYDTNDTNLADAYALARVAYAQAAEPAMPGFQLEVIKALVGRTEWHPTWSATSSSETSSGEKTTKDSLSSSADQTTPEPSQRRLLVRSGKANGSGSEPSVPRRLIRRSRERPSVAPRSPSQTS